MIVVYALTPLLIIISAHGVRGVATVPSQGNCFYNAEGDSVKKEILSNWELQEPPKHGKARLMKIRTLDSMEEIDGANGLEGSEREQRDPRGIAGRNVREASEGESNTAFTFGVPMVVDKTGGRTAHGESAQAAPEGRENGRSETLVSLRDNLCYHVGGLITISVSVKFSIEI